jgi:hypothetical protein
VSDRIVSRNTTLTRSELLVRGSRIALEFGSFVVTLKRKNVFSAFLLHSPALDYRRSQRVVLTQALTVSTGCFTVSRIRLAALPKINLPTALRRRRPITINSASTSVPIASRLSATS